MTLALGPQNSQKNEGEFDGSELDDCEDVLDEVAGC